MNSERLLQNFDRLIDTPDAVPRLRRFILDLAVRGKLVEQNPEDETAEELLKRIKTEKKRIIQTEASGHIRTFLTINVKNERFNLPGAWTWVSIEDIAYVEMGQSPSSEFYNQHREGMPFYQGKADFGKIHPTPRYWCTAPTKIAQKGDVLISVRAPVGPTNVATETCCIGRGLAALRPFHGYDRDFLLICLKQSEDHLESLGVGATFVAINRMHLTTFPISLPPLAEQHRIVAKVDELMKLCDTLEEAQAKRERRRDRLVAATLHGLNNGDSDSDASKLLPFKDRARFYFTHLPRLTTRPEHIQQLRQTILNLAVRGKLVPQYPDDEPASELLKQIEVEKFQRFGSSNKKTQTMDEDQIPSAIPDNWQWTQLARIGVINPRNDAEDSIDASFVPMPLIFAKYGRENQHEVRAWSEIKKGFTHFAEGDVGLAKITPCFENGKSTVFRNLTGGLGAGTTELHIVRPVLINPDYILIFLKSPYFIGTGIPKMTGTAGQKRVPKDYFAFSPFPLPPLAEQHRIVAKVNELMALCDELETRVTTDMTTNRKFLEATLQEALSGANYGVEAIL